MIIAWIELIIMLLKAVLLSAVYSFIIVLFLFLIYKIFDIKSFKKHLQFVMFFYIVCGFIIFISLFKYRFSYWEDIGMGETLQVPVGYEQYVYNADGAMTYFDLEPDEDEYLRQDHLHIEKYYISGKLLCAEVSHEFTDHPDFKYMVYDLEAKAAKHFQDVTEYDSYAAEHQLPPSSKFYDFADHYNTYTQMRPLWKKWLLL